MNGRLAALLLAMAAIPPAYAGFVYGWQLVTFGGFAVRVDDALSPDTWIQVAVIALPFIAIAAALFVMWEGVSRRRPRRALIALAVAWIASLPLYLTLLRG